MKSSLECLMAHQVNLMIDGELSPSEAAAVEEHLSACETCRAKLDDASVDLQWWNEARQSLSSSASPDSGTNAAPDAPYEDVLRLLGPTDDPRMLGRIASYEIAGILGRGGMGVVFKAFDAALNRYVA